MPTTAPGTFVHSADRVGGNGVPPVPFRPFDPYRDFAAALNVSRRQAQAITAPPRLYDFQRRQLESFLNGGPLSGYGGPLFGAGKRSTDSLHLIEALQEQPRSVIYLTPKEE